MQPTTDSIDRAEKIVTLVRDFVLLALLLAAVAFLYIAWPNLQASLKHVTVESLNLGAVSLKLNSESVNAYGGPPLTVDTTAEPVQILEKSSLSQLTTITAKKIDVLSFSSDQSYSGATILAYMARLSPQFIILHNGEKLEAWSAASTFAAQIATPEPYSYQRLLGLSGLRKDWINKGATARAALEMMSSKDLDHLAVIDDAGRFTFMASREAILSKVITSVVLAEK